MGKLLVLLLMPLMLAMFCNFAVSWTPLKQAMGNFWTLSLFVFDDKSHQFKSLLKWLMTPAMQDWFSILW